jgi:hypothetical protein
LAVEAGFVLEHDHHRLRVLAGLLQGRGDHGGFFSYSGSGLVSHAWPRL